VVDDRLNCITHQVMRGSLRLAVEVLEPVPAEEPQTLPTQ
jgi:hypothetical protein